MIGKVGFQKGLRVDQHQLITAGDQIFMVTIGAAEQVQQGGETAGVAVVALQLLSVGAKSVGHMLHIAVAVAGLHHEAAQGRQLGVGIEVLNQGLVGRIHSHVFGFVDQKLGVAAIW